MAEIGSRGDQRQSSIPLVAQGRMLCSLPNLRKAVVPPWLRHRRFFAVPGTQPCPQALQTSTMARKLKYGMGAFTQLLGAVVSGAEEYFNDRLQIEF